MRFSLRPLVAALSLAAVGTSFAATALSDATAQWTYTHSASNGYLSEIVSFDSLTRTLWVSGVSGVDILDARTGAFVSRIDVSAWGAINSVAIHNGIAAFALENTSDRTLPGVVKLYDTGTRSLLAGTNTIAVGALPDMLTFTADGSRLLVANEGTPSVYGSEVLPRAASGTRVYSAAAQDPVGSVSLIDMASRSVYATATFASAPISGSHLRTGTGMDFEPEYIATNAAGTRAYVTLQEANGMGVIDLNTGSVVSVVGLGAKDFSAPGNRIDPLNNGSAVLQSVNAKGLYMPDGVAAYSAKGQTFLVMANEGDFREDDADRSAASSFGATGTLANLRVSNTDSSPGALYAAGTRSFSIRAEDGTLVYDSGEILDREAIALGIYDDARSRDKGVEPEGVELMTLGGRTFAFIGLERTTTPAVGVFDITDPANTSFVRMLVLGGNRSPEGLKGFTMDGYAYLALSSEVSNTTALVQLAPVPEPGTWGLMAAGLLGLGTLARRRLAGTGHAG